MTPHEDLQARMVPTEADIAAASSDIARAWRDDNGFWVQIHNWRKIRL